MNRNLTNSPPIAVVIPAYRAQQHIQNVLRSIPPSVSHVIVVDDASPDITAQLVQEVSDPRIILINHEDNQGVGGAMLTGYRKAIELGAEIIVKMDADEQMDPRYLFQLAEPICRGEADYAKGNRFLHTRHLKNMPWVRRVGNTGLSFLTKLASGYWNVFDPTNGYTAIHAAVLSAIEVDNIDRRFFYESSMLIELGLARAVVKDIYIPAVYEGEMSSLSELDALIRFPWKLLRGLVHRIIVQYFIRDFNTVSILLLAGIPAILFGLAFGIYHWTWSAYHGIPTNTGTVMVSVIPFILGVQFVLQALTLDVQSVPSVPLQQSYVSPLGDGQVATETIRS